MSGYSNRTKSDICAIEQQQYYSAGPGNYRMLADVFVHPSHKSAADSALWGGCDVMQCTKCDGNKNATLSIGADSFADRVDIEDNLRGSKRILTKCADNGYAPCSFPSKRPAGECKNVIAFNPRVCERNIVPTNARFPTSTGFD